MECEVLKKATSVDEALDVVAKLPQPVCIIIIKDGYNIIREYAYQDIVEKIGKKIPVMCKGTSTWAAENMLSKKKNIILTVSDSGSGSLHKIIYGLRTVVDNVQGSLVGIRAKPALYSTGPTTGCSVEPHSSISDCLDCLVVVNCS